MRCMRSGTTDNARDGYNVVLYENQLARVIDLDAYGDARIILLSEMGAGDLLKPIKRHCILMGSFCSFSRAVPPFVGAGASRS